MLKDLRSHGSNREELRKRFVKAETALFRIRYGTDNMEERDKFLESMKFNWSKVCPDTFSRSCH